MPTVKALKQAIRTHKQSGVCPAYSKLNKAELIAVANRLDLDVPQGGGRAGRGRGRARGRGRGRGRQRANAPPIGLPPVLAAVANF